MDYQNQEVLRYTKAFQARPNGFLFDNTNLYVYGNDNQIKIYNFENLQQIGILQGHTASILTLIKIDDLLISGGTDKKIFIWDSQKFKKIDFLHGFKSFIKQIQYYKEDKILISFGDGSIMIFDYKKKGYKEHEKIHKSDIDFMSQATIQHDGQLIQVLITGDLEGIIKVMNLEKFENIYQIEQHYNSIKQIKYLGNNIFVSCSKDGNIKFFEFGCNKYQMEDL